MKIETAIPRRQEPIRALTYYASLPPAHCTLLVRDDASAPHLKVGEYAVIDTTDCELQKGELYAIEYGGVGEQQRRIIQIRAGHIWSHPSGRRESVWWVDELAGFRRTNETIGGIPVFAGMSDGPYSARQMKKRLVGRVVGYADAAI
jgi:hypothetical protein